MRHDKNKNPVHGTHSISHHVQIEAQKKYKKMVKTSQNHQFQFGQFKEDHPQQEVSILL